MTNDTYLLWYDRRPKFNTRLDAAVAFYVKKHKVQPSVCLINSGEFTNFFPDATDSVNINGVVVSGKSNVLKSHLMLR